MDIRTKDAAVGHEAKIGSISDDAVFYLMSRGMTEEDARALLVSGFADNVSKELPVEYAVEMTFEGKLIDATHVEFLGYTFECAEVQDIEPGSSVLVEIDFRNVILEDNEEDGHLTGEVKFILYKGNHYHLTVFTDWDEDIFVDTTDVWDDGDRVGITIAPENIRIVAPAQTTGSIPIVESAI